MEKFIISKEDATLLLNFLANRPYIEVAKLIPILMTLKPLQPSCEECDCGNKE